MSLSTPASRADLTRIGLVRHLPVRQALPRGWMTAADLGRWRQHYDAAEVLSASVELAGIEWQTCLSSDLPRAHQTAAVAYAGEIECTPLLREPELATFDTGTLRLPVPAWQWLLRLAWLSGHRSQRAARDDFRQRVHTVADRLCGLSGNVLVVSHAGMMAFLSAELRRRGFAGPKLRIAQHAKAYVYERSR